MPDNRATPVKIGALLIAMLASCLLWPSGAQADLFTIDRYSDSNVLVSDTLYSMPDISSIDWSDASYANVVTHKGWGSVEGARWISELSGASGPGGSYRVYHMEITLPDNAQDLTGSLEYMVDDYLWFYVNQDLAAQNTVYGNWKKLNTVDFTSYLATGLTSVVLDIVVQNSGTRNNPLGISFHTSLSGEVADAHASTPEPGSMLLLCSALGGVALYGRKKRFQLLFKS